MPVMKCENISHTKYLLYIKHFGKKKDNSNNLYMLMLPDSREYKRLQQLGK